ncbi:MAG: hypothetical protein Q9M28_08300, partial [Mariprofundaceae bacterium]|nr:hypothetical protein [Mariprofundaceae bacterium]
MGHKATASAGAVLAHHSAPLQRVLKELRAAEQTAKNAGGRDAFSIRVLKRGGGTVSTTAQWFSKELKHPICLLEQLAKALGGKKMSRRASYHAQAWLRDLPSREIVKENAMFERMLKANLQRQFKQQGGDDTDVELAGHLIDMACAIVQKSKSNDDKEDYLDEAKFLEEFLSVAEFLGRQGRMGESS